MFKIFNKKVGRSYDPRGFLDEVTTEPKWKGKTVQKSRSNKVLERRQKTVDYLLTREGKPTSLIQISKKAGVTPSGACLIVQELTNRGTIRRSGPTNNLYTVRYKRVHGRRTPSAKAVKAPVKAKKAIRKSYDYSSGISQEVVDKVLRYITNNEDKPVSVNVIAQAVGSSDSSTGRAVRKLVEEKAVVRSLPAYGGTRYWLAKSVVDGPNIKAAKAPAPVETSYEEQLHHTIDSLVWQFMKECKQTDILLFLEWLKQGK